MTDGLELTIVTCTSTLVVKVHLAQFFLSVLGLRRQGSTPLSEL